MPSIAVYGSNVINLFFNTTNKNTIDKKQYIYLISALTLMR